MKFFLFLAHIKPGNGINIYKIVVSYLIKIGENLKSNELFVLKSTKWVHMTTFFIININILFKTISLYMVDLVINRPHKREGRCLCKAYFILFKSFFVSINFEDINYPFFFLNKYTNITMLKFLVLQKNVFSVISILYLIK